MKETTDEEGEKRRNFTTDYADYADEEKKREEKKILVLEEEEKKLMNCY